jgi:hypothetical protein
MLSDVNVSAMYVTSPVVSLSRKIEMSYDILDMQACAREGIMGRGSTAPQASIPTRRMLRLRVRKIHDRLRRRVLTLDQLDSDLA